MRYVYLVNGEHDGLLGAYSNFEKAENMATSYAKQNEQGVLTINNEYDHITYYSAVNQAEIIKEPVFWLMLVTIFIGGHHGLITSKKPNRRLNKWISL